MPKFISLFAFIIIFLMTALPSFAQEPPAFDVSFTYAVNDAEAKSGDILMNADGGLIRADTPSSNLIFGVLQDNAVIVYRSLEEDNEQVIARAGISMINVSDINGQIKKGDFVTSSAIPGKGQRASGSGYIVGVALEDFDLNAAQAETIDGLNLQTGQIPVAIRIEYAEIDSSRSVNRVLELLNAAVFRNVQDPEKFVQIIRYVVAGLIIILGFTISFFTFSRTASKGIEAIGRNPLAKNTIQLSMIINVVLTIATALIGLVASFVILRL